MSPYRRDHHTPISEEEMWQMLDGALELSMLEPDAAWSMAWYIAWDARHYGFKDVHRAAAALLECIHPSWETPDGAA